jgi:UDP:flavonoid glycosyltransferase YjiC (YdhE family)
MIKSPRILLYAVNGLGLGHVTRLMSIARQLRAQRPAAQILFLTSTDAAAVLTKEDFAAVKVPSKSARSRQRLATARFAELVQSVTWSAVSAFHPHLMVVDTFPAGALQELVPLLTWEMARAFVFREQRLDRAEHPLVQNSLALYDRVIVPHREGEAEIPVPEGPDVRWVGPVFIRDRSEALSREEARERLGLPTDGPILYAAFGGGGDPDSTRYLEVVAKTLREIGVTGAFAPGPLSQHRALPEGLKAMKRVDYYPMAECLTAFDGAVSAAGYNSVMELLHHGVPSLFIPLERQVDDQAARCRWASDAGAALMLSEPTLADLRAKIETLLDPGIAAGLRQKAMALVPESGAGRAAAALLELADRM